MRRRQPQMIALRIATVYAVAAGLWILFSDRLLEVLVADPSLENRLQTVKGWGFVAVTALVLHALIHRGLASLDDSRAEARSMHGRLATAVESLSKGLILWDEQGRLVICNSACRTMLSRLDQELRRGAAFGSLMAALNHHYRPQPAVSRTLSEGSREFRLDDGRWIELSERRIEGGGIIAVVTDISQGRRWEEAMAAMVMDSQDHRPFFEAAAETVAMALDCRWAAVAIDCRKAADRTGSPTRLDLLAVWHDGAGAPYSLDLGGTALMSLLDGAYHSVIVDPAPLMPGRPPGQSPAGLAVMPFFARRGRVAGYLLAVRGEAQSFDSNQRRFLDLMARWAGAEYERNRAVEALRESESRFRLALQLEEMVVFLQDRDLRYIWIHNPHLGYPVEAVIGKRDGDLMPSGDARLLSELKSTVIATGQGRRDLVTVHDPRTGEPHFYTLILEPLREADGEVAGVRGAAIDITEEHTVRRDLERARAKAERVSQSKSRFLAAASHDMRQPLQAMRLFLDLLQARLQDQTLRMIADKVSEALDGGTGLLNALLDVSSLEAGLVRPQIREVAVQDLFAQLRADYDRVAAAKGLTLRTMSCRVLVRSDPTLLARILGNFLANAIAHSERGSILLGCRRRGRKLWLEVWDTGPGIAPDQQEAIWEVFYQIGNPERDRRQGLGLGLPIVERMAQLLGHKVTMCSQPGKGSVFAVEVERAEEGEERGAEDAAAASSARDQ